jgi:hypothetical protein
MEIANWAKPTGICEFLSVKRIAEVVEVAPRTIQRHMTRLETPCDEGGLGMIRRLARHRDDGGQGANSFELVGYDMPSSPPRQSVTPPRQIVTPPRQIDGEPGDTAVTRLGDKIIPPTPASAGVPPHGENQEEGEQEAVPEPPQPADPPAPAEPKGTRLPADWTPPPIDELQPMARDLVREWPRGAYEAVSATFALHWQGEPGSRGIKKNWQSTHAKWLINDHARVMRAAKAGVSFAALAPDAPAAAATMLGAPPVPEQMIEGSTADGLRAQLKAILGDRLYTHWFSGVALLMLAQGELRVVAQSPFQQGYIAANFESELLRAAQRAGHAVIIIKTVVTDKNEKDRA